MTSQQKYYERPFITEQNWARRKGFKKSLLITLKANAAAAFFPSFFFLSVKANAF